MATILVDKPRHKDRGHTIYKTQDGKRVPGTTTITGVMDKPQLVRWANNLGLEGIDSSKYVDGLADAGTLAHYMVECDLAGIAINPEWMKEYSLVDQDRAANSFLKYLDWRKRRTIEVVAHELQLVSEEHRFGGTLDWIMVIDGVLCLVDVKTCKALYGSGDEKWTQVAGGYRILAREHGYDVAQVWILRLGRNEEEDAEFVQCIAPAMHERRFLLCRELYELNKRLKGEAA